MKPLSKIKLKQSEIERFNSKFLKLGEDQCWPWQAGRFDNGYGQFFLRRQSIGAHRIAYIIAYGDYDDVLFVCHNCNHKFCVNPKHLYLGTHEQNMQDAVQDGLSNKGEKNGQCLLTEQEVINIRELYSTSMYSQREVARIFKISQALVNNILLNKNWSHIPNTQLA